MYNQWITNAWCKDGQCADNIIWHIYLYHISSELLADFGGNSLEWWCKIIKCWWVSSFVSQFADGIVISIHHWLTSMIQWWGYSHTSGPNPQHCHYFIYCIASLWHPQLEYSSVGCDRLLKKNRTKFKVEPVLQFPLENSQAQHKFPSWIKN